MLDNMLTFDKILQCLAYMWKLAKGVTIYCIVICIKQKRIGVIGWYEAFSIRPPPLPPKVGGGRAGVKVKEVKQE